MENGDLTLVGEGRVSLSDTQKARIGLHTDTLEEYAWRPLFGIVIVHVNVMNVVNLITIMNGQICIRKTSAQSFLRCQNVCKITKLS